MTAFQMPNWAEMFAPDVSVAESFLRASLVYVGLVLLFRVGLRRQGGSIGASDVLLAVLVSGCVVTTLNTNTKAIPNGLVSVAALLFWNFVLNQVASRWAWARRVLEPQPLTLVENGRPIREHLAKEGMSDAELAAQLRHHGIDDVSRVKAAVLESEGKVSVVKAEAGGPPSADDLREAVRRLEEATDAVQALVSRQTVGANGPSGRQGGPNDPHPHFLADDHALIREGVKGVLRGLCEFEVVGEAADGPTAVERVAELNPDVVILNTSTPGLTATGVTARLRADRPDRRVLVLTDNKDRGTTRGYWRRASGCVPSRVTADELVQAVRAVAAGGTHFDPSVGGDDGPVAETVELSDREVEVVRLIAQGYSNKQIAAKLSVSVKTVETYKARSMEKLGTRTRVGLVRYAVERGWLTAV